MNKFSGLVMTLDEEKNIQGCLSSLFLVCDDVVVVDSNSKDKTVEIAEKLGATVLLQDFLGDGPQRSFGARHCKHDWIIYLDADERLDQDLIDELPGLELENESVEAYECRRKNHMHGRWIKVAGQYPDYICRIFNKSKTDFSPDQIHARIETNKLLKASGHILHHSFENLNDMIRRMNLYSDWHSEDLFNRQKRVSSLAPVTHGLISFFKFYIFRRGFMAGLDGLSLSITNSLGSYFKYAKLIEKNDNDSDKE